jgi:dolichol-phosphate mannosyltransferase
MSASNSKEKSDRRPHISVVIPVYACRECLPELVRRLDASIKPINDNYELILVDDASPDGSWESIEKLCIENNCVKGIRFSRNFGQHYAITAGLTYAQGDWIVVMDCDLQDQPEEIPKLYSKAQEGFDVVFARRFERQDGFLKKLSSKIYYKVYDYFTEQQSDSTIANFGIYSAKVIENFRLLKERNRTFPLFVRWLGFTTAEVDVEHANRFAGKSSYNFPRMIRLALDGIVSQSNKPLRVSVQFGFLMSFLSMLYAFYLVLKYFLYGVPVQGWTSLIVSLYFLVGIILSFMGILGLYIGKVFNETKNRPLYIIDETLGMASRQLDQEYEKISEIVTIVPQDKSSIGKQ